MSNATVVLKIKEGAKMDFKETKSESDSSVISALDTNIKQVTKLWQKIKKLHSEWDINNIKSTLESYNLELNQLNTNNTSGNSFLSEKIDTISKHIGSTEYITDLESLLKKYGIPFIGEFPEYDIPPYRLSISKENMEARLFFGRKSEKITSMNPENISNWINIKYKKITGKKFDINVFMKELFDAYQYINKITFRNKDTIWGKAIKLTEIYGLLTLKRSTKQEYPAQVYQFELGLLKENLNLSFNDYRFEFGFARDINKAIAIIDSSGKVNYVSSLTIYKEV